MNITPFDSRRADQWDRFVRGTANGTVFHEQLFFDYHPADRFEWHHLVFGDPAAPSAVLPAAIVEHAEGVRELRSPAGATLGGPALRERLGLEHTRELIARLVDHARGSGFGRIVLGTVPAIYWRQPDDTLEFALRDAGFACEAQLMHYLAVDQLPENDPIGSIAGRRKARFRQAMAAGLELGVAETRDQIAEFHAVVADNRAQFGCEPGHSIDELCELQHRLGERLRLFTARKDAAVVAGLYALTAAPGVCYAQYIADRPDERHLGAARFLLIEVLRRLQREGFGYFDLGPSARLPIEKTTLAHFKESAGAVGCERRLWTKDLR